MRPQARCLIVALGTALTLLLGLPQELRAAERLRIIYSAISGSFAPIWIAQEAGLFEREGLRTDLVYIATSTIAVPSLISGDSQIMMGGGGAVVLARLGGADINVFATSLPVIVQMLIAPPSIGRPADLKGKRVGVTRIGALSDFTLRYLIRKWGMDPDRDIRILQMGGLPEVLLGLQAGRIDAGVTAPPHTVRAAKLGIRILSDASIDGPRYPAIVLAAMDSYLNPDLLT